MNKFQTKVREWYAPLKQREIKWYKAKRELLKEIERCIDWQFEEMRDDLKYVDVSYSGRLLYTWWGSLEWPQYAVRDHFDELRYLLDLRENVEKLRYRLTLTTSQTEGMIRTTNRLALYWRE